MANSKKIQELYYRIFALELLPDKQNEIKQIREQIDNLLKSDTEPLQEFLVKMKDKTFTKNIRQLNEGTEVDDITLAKMLSSFITHALIEMEKTGSHVYEELNIPEASTYFNNFIQGLPNSKGAILDFFKNCK